jgi:hypothetical protein
MNRSNSVAPRQRLCFCISAIHRSSWRPLWLDSGCGSLARMTTGTWYQQAHYSTRHRDQSAYLPYPFKTISQCGSPPSWNLSAAGSAEGRRKPAKSREPTPEPTYAMQHGVTGLFLQPTNTRRAIPPSPRSLPLSARLSCTGTNILGTLPQYAPEVGPTTCWLCATPRAAASSGQLTARQPCLHQIEGWTCGEAYRERPALQEDCGRF